MIGVMDHRLAPLNAFQGSMLCVQAVAKHWMTSTSEGARTYTAFGLRSEHDSNKYETKHSGDKGCPLLAEGIRSGLLGIHLRNVRAVLYIAA